MRALAPRLAAFALALLPAVALAQAEMIDLDAARRPFLEKQLRPAAYALRIASSALRSEIGRCKDETIGAALMEAEPRIDKLAARVAAGGVASVEVLDREFAAIDRMMAQHHQALAADNWGKGKIIPNATVARDLGFAANYLARSARWDGVALAPEAGTAVEAARATAKRLADSADRPAEAGAVIDKLGEVIAARVAATAVGDR